MKLNSGIEIVPVRTGLLDGERVRAVHEFHAFRLAVGPVAFGVQSLKDLGAAPAAGHAVLGRLLADLRFFVSNSY